MKSPWLTLLAIAVAGALPSAAVAKPHVTGSFALPKGLGIGGFDRHGLIEGPDGALWMTTGSPSTPGAKKPVLVRVTGAGKVSTIKVPVPGGIDFNGLATGPDGKVWFSGTASGGDHRGYSGRVVGHSVQMKEATDSASWFGLAAIGPTAYVVDGFNNVETSTDGETFGPGGLDNGAPWDIGVLGGNLYFVGDGGVGWFTPGATTATLFAGPGGITLGSRSMTIAGGAMWFLQSDSQGIAQKLAKATPDGAVALHPLPAGASDIVTGPDGDPWVLAQHSLLHINASGGVAAKVKLPGGMRGILVSAGPSRTLWVAAVSSSGVSRMLRITAK